MDVRASRSSPWINVAVIGPHQQGKSTLAGFLLYALDQIPPTLIDEADQAASNRNDPSRKFAFLLDRKAHERMITSAGCKGTQETSWWGWERKKHHYLLIDSPGRHDRMASLIGALSDADAALLVVDTGAYFEDLKQKEIAEGEQKQNIPHTIAQIYTQLALARFYEISQLIIALHKMDVINFLESTYQRAKSHLELTLEKFGWNKSQIHFVPTAVIATEAKGYNIIKSDPVFNDWPQQTTLLRAIEQLHPQPASTSNRFRMQLSAVHQGKRMPIPGFQLAATGRVAAGTVQMDDELLIQPSGTHCKVRRIQSIDNFRYIEKAIRGEPIRLHCMILEGDAKLGIGEIVGTITSSPHVSQHLQAELEALTPVPLSDGFTKNFSGTFVLGHFSTRFRIDSFSLDGGITWQSGGQKQALLLNSITNLNQRNAILVNLHLAQPTPLEIYTQDNHFGRFVLLNSHLSPICGGHTIEVLSDLLPSTITG